MKKLTTEEFIEKARKVHGDKYIYTETEYKSSEDKVCIICPIHGKFWQQAREHLRGQGCPSCSNRGSNKNGSCTYEEFVEKARKVHGDKYDYSESVYVNNSTKLCVICPIHGKFWITPDKHINRKQGCSACSQKRRLTTEEFIRRAKLIHGDIYIYTEAKYINNHTDVCIICPIHGIFWQNPKAHLSGCGCPKCNSSHLEEEMRIFLINHNIDFNEQQKFPWLKQQSLDFYIPQYNLGIECQGEQHFKGWNRKKESLKEIKTRDKLKYQLCQENGIRLLYYSNLGIEYPYQVYENKEELLEEIKKTQ